MNSFVCDETMELMTRLLIAAVLGALIGLERDVHGRAAGLRTHLLVGLGAGLFMIMSELVALRGNIQGVSDPGRIAAQSNWHVGVLPDGFQDLVSGLFSYLGIAITERTDGTQKLVRPQCHSRKL